MKETERKKSRAASILTVLLSLAALCALAYVSARLYYPANKYSEQIASACAESDVPQSVVFAVMKSESNFDGNALSDKGAAGLMQLMPDTFQWICEARGEEYSPERINDADSNIDAGVWYLSFLYGKYGSWDTVFAAYNAGQGRVSEWLDGSGKETLDDIPYPETEKYVSRVKRAQIAYRRLYGME